MKFAHMADVHIGAWRDPKLKDLSTIAFSKAIDICISEGVEFVLISGDLFNTALPPLDNVKIVFRKLRELKEKGIRVYYLAGSHDFSVSGKTMLDIIEEVGLGVNVCKSSEGEKLKLCFVEDKTGVKITGLLGKKGGLDKEYYNFLDLEHLENEPGEKIFLFHNAIAELRSSIFEKVDAVPISCFPKGFSYYAGGHIHVVDHKSIDSWNNIAFPGPIFPCNFEELERLGRGSFFIVEDWTPRMVPVELNPVKSFQIDCNKLSPEEVTEKCCSVLEGIDDCIVTLRFKGKLREGKVSQIDLGRIYAKCESAYFVMKNMSKVESPEFAPVKVETGPVDEIESKLIAENTGNFMEKEREISIVKSLMKELSSEKNEGETVASYESRIVENARKTTDF